MDLLSGSGVRVILDLCELDLFEQKSNNDTEVWSGASESIQVITVLLCLL